MRALRIYLKKDDYTFTKLTKERFKEIYSNGIESNIPYGELNLSEPTMVFLTLKRNGEHYGVIFVLAYNKVDAKKMFLRWEEQEQWIRDEWEDMVNGNYGFARD